MDIPSLERMKGQSTSSEAQLPIFVSPRAWDMRPWQIEKVKAWPHGGERSGFHCDRRGENHMHIEEKLCRDRAQQEGWLGHLERLSLELFTLNFSEETVPCL